MDTISVELQANHKGNVTVVMQCKNDSDYFELPSGKEVVYNDNEYIFVVDDKVSLPKEIYINDESFDVRLIKHENGYLYCRRYFLSFP